MLVSSVWLLFSGSLFWGSMRKSGEKAAFALLYRAMNYRTNENKIKDTILEFCRVQPIIIKDNV